MTRNDLPKFVSTWGPIVGLLLSGAVAWTTLKRDVNDKLDTARYVADSINVQHTLQDHARELQRAARQEQLNAAICAALPRCVPPR